MTNTEREQTLVKKLGHMIEEERKQNKIYGLKLSKTHVNLARKSYVQAWSTWWTGKLPPELEVDLVMAFEDHSKLIDDALLLAVEIEYFSKGKRGNFYQGLNQAQAFAIFGFDGIVLWHLFRDVEQDMISSYASAVKDLIEGFSLPIVYFASEITEDWKFRCFQPVSDTEGDLSYIIAWMRNHFNDDKYSNPLLFSQKLPVHRHELAERIRQRRRTLKTVLGIP